MVEGVSGRPCPACDGEGTVLDFQHDEDCFRAGTCVGGQFCPREVEVECPVCEGSGGSKT